MAGKWNRPSRAEDVISRMPIEQVESMVVHWLRLPTMLASAVSMVTPAAFHRPDELYLKILWTAVLSVPEKDRQGGRVPYARLRAVVQDAHHAFADAPGADDHLEMLLVEPDGADGDCGLLYHAYKKVPDEDLDAQTCLCLLQRFCAERIVYDEGLRAMMGGPGDEYVPARMTERVDDISRMVRKLGGLTYDTALPLVPAPGTYKGRKFWLPGGIRFLTDATGGFAPGEVYGLAGPSGQGKTPMAMQVAIACAEHQAAIAASGKGEARDVFYMFYELTTHEIYARTWAATAKVDKDRVTALDEFLLFDDPRLTRTDTPAAQRPQYEHVQAKMSQVPIGQYPGESERLKEAAAFLGPYLCLEELSGQAGFGGINELVGILLKRADQRKRAPAMVVVDYCNLAVRRYCMTREINVDEKGMRTPIANYIDGLLNQVAKQMECSVLVVQQIAGRHTDRPAGAPMHHNMCSESSMFAENLTTCSILGNRDKETKVQALWHSKTRNTGRVFGHDLIILDGHLQCYRPAVDYVLRNGQLVSELETDALAMEVRPSTPSRPRPATRMTSDPNFGV